MIYRDDDVNVYTNSYQFKELHQRFIEAKQEHTVAVLMKDLWENHALFWYLATAPYLKIGLHGWEHKDYSKMDYEDCLFDIDRSLKYWQENSQRMVQKAKPIDTFFAPWNRRGPNIIRACETAGLKFCDTGNGDWNGEEIKSFHWWNVMDDNFQII